MKVPSPTQGQTKPSARGMDYLRAAVPDFSALERGLSSFGASIEKRQAEAKVKADQADRFKMLTQVNDFELGAADLQTQLQKTTPIGDTNHVEVADSSYINYSNKFLEGVDPKFQDEFRVQISRVGQTFGLNARAFEQQQSNKFYNQKIDDAANYAKLQVENNPAQMEEYNARMRDMIQSIPDWSMTQKAEALLANDLALKGIVYKKDVAFRQVQEKSQDLTTQVVKSFEGYVSQARWDVNAHRVGYGSDTITKADGTVVKVTPGMVTSREDADRDLRRRLGEFQGGIIKKIGEPTWAALPEHVRAGLTSVAYNYGSLPANVAEAAKTANPILIAQAIKSHEGDNGGVNSERRNKEAVLVAGGNIDLPIKDNIDDDPRYAGLPYETRVSLRDAAQTDANQLMAAQQKQKAAAQSDFYDKTYKGIIANQPGFDQAYADEALQLGALTPEDHSKISTLLNKKNGDASDAAKGTAMLQNGTLWTTSNQKEANALFGDAGKASLQNGDEGYLQNELIPFIGKTNLIPSDAVESFDSLMKSINPKQQLYALDALSQIRQAHGGAYAAQVPERMQQKVDFYNSATLAGMDAKFIYDTVADRVTPEMAQARQVNGKEAERVLEMKSTNPEYNPNISFEKLASTFKTSGYFGSLNYPATPQALVDMESDYKFLMKENYIKTGNWDAAFNMTQEQVKRTWGTTKFGGNEVLMKHAPQNMYPEYANRPNFNFMQEFENQARTELRLPPGVEMQVLSDNKTFSDFVATQDYKNPGGAASGKQLLHDVLPFGLGSFVDVPKVPRPPSYIVMTKNPAGYWEEARDPNTNQVVRYSFAYTPQMQANEDVVFNARNLARKAIDAQAEVDRGRQQLGEIGKPALDELKAKAAAAKDAADVAKEAAQPVLNPPVQAPGSREEIQRQIELNNQKEPSIVKDIVNSLTKPLYDNYELEKMKPTPSDMLEGYPPSVLGMTQAGNTPLNSGISDITIYEENGAFTLLPKAETEQATISNYNLTQGHFGVFADRKSAEDYAASLKAKK